jgi:hypothetical protein
MDEHIALHTFCSLKTKITMSLHCALLFVYPVLFICIFRIITFEKMDGFFIKFDINVI